MRETLLSPETWRRVNLLFSAEEREEAATLLVEQCGTDLPGLSGLSACELERFHFAALKLSEGDLPKLRCAIKSAQMDWRDLLMAAGFGRDVHAHETWLP